MDGASGGAALAGSAMMRQMLDALFWGLVGGSTLVVGALAGCFVRLPRRVTGAVMAAGAGVLISSVAYELVDEAAMAGTLKHTALGMALGGLAFFAGAVLTMLSSTMLPEAAEDGGPVIGLVTTAGFLAAVLLDRL